MAQTLKNVPHYQVPARLTGEFLEALKKEKQNRKGTFDYSYFTGKEDQFTDEFLFFVKTVPDSLMAFDWMGLAEKVFAADSIDEDRGTRMSSYGYAGWNCSERVPHNCGVASPGQHKGTEDPMIVDTFVKYSELIAHYFPVESGVFVTDEVRSEHFEKRIHAKNIIDAISVVISDASKFAIKRHVDSSNDGSSKGLAAVFSVSKYIELKGKVYRISLIAYKKQAIAEFMPTFTLHRPMLERLAVEFEFLTEEEREVTADLLLPKTAVSPKRIGIRIDKTVFYSVYAYAIMRLFRK